MTKISKILAASVVLVGSVWSLHATPAEYIFTGVGSGIFDNVPFTDDSFTVNLYGDTSGIYQLNPNTYDVDVTGNISVAGLGSDTINVPLYAFNNQGDPTAGFGITTDEDWLDVGPAPGESTYAMNTSFGPVAGPVFFTSGHELGTDGGYAQLFSVSDTTFQAIVGNTAPDGGMTLILLGGGFSALAALRRKIS